MPSYTNEFSQFPNQLLTLHHYKDVDDTVANEVNQIKLLQMQGQFDKVNTIIGQHPELKPYVFGSEAPNLLEEETRNIEIFIKSKKQQIYYTDTEPEEAVLSDIWIGD